MKRQLLVAGLMCAVLTLSVVADEKHDHQPKVHTNVGFEKMKTLVGTWVAADDKGQPTEQVVSVIKLTAGGSALQETLFPGEPQEMVSIYTPEGSSVVMTHYCMLGNQPQMKAKSDALGNSLNFEFVGGGNLDPQKDMHMHSAVLKFVDADHFEVDGTGWENGKPSKEMCNGMKLVRKK
ncbi:hypothetical protein [Planctomicrobium piriforme]|uniref:DUF1579 domain-containing protein n=1 Tax=Planctomicrobium piriforme TaxID=1576369 RepID=A0A1I3SAQ2_9PLAN|nr:hypothetical protein [Planctomicrobium piriforme]SFJ55775.1 hypothetical protein SAMN05421753_12381 [Planctomicrobium piriforme]